MRTARQCDGFTVTSERCKRMTTEPGGYCGRCIGALPQSAPRQQGRADLVDGGNPTIPTARGVYIAEHPRWFYEVHWSYLNLREEIERLPDTNTPEETVFNINQTLCRYQSPESRDIELSLWYHSQVGPHSYETLVDAWNRQAAA